MCEQVLVVSSAFERTVTTQQHQQVQSEAQQTLTFYDRLSRSYFRAACPHVGPHFEREHINLRGEAFEEPEILCFPWQIALIRHEYERFERFLEQEAEVSSEEEADEELYERIVGDLNEVLDETC